MVIISVGVGKRPMKTLQRITGSSSVFVTLIGLSWRSRREPAANGEDAAGLHPILQTWLYLPQLPTANLHRRTSQKERRAGCPFVLISFLLFSAKQSICIPLFICLLSLWWHTGPNCTSPLWLNPPLSPGNPCHLQKSAPHQPDVEQLALLLCTRHCAAEPWNSWTTKKKKKKKKVCRVQQ